MKITARFAQAKSAQAASSQYLRSSRIAVPDDAYGLDRLVADFAAQTAHVHVDDVRSRIEREAPDGGEELFPRTHVPVLSHQVLEEEELPCGERDPPSVCNRDPPGQIEPECAAVEEPRRRDRL